MRQDEFTRALLREQLKLANRIAEAQLTCPICGCTGPHAHSGLDTSGIWRGFVCVRCAVSFGLEVRL